MKVLSVYGLHRAAFPGPLQYDREQKYAVDKQGFSADIAAEIDKLRWCDLLILQFPLWWYSVPAILKGWFDRTISRHGWCRRPSDISPARQARGGQ